MMKINKKLILHTLIFEVIGILLYISTCFLSIFNIIDVNNTFLNGMIYILSSIVCISYYANIYQKYLHTACIKDCVLLAIIVIIIGVPEIIIALKTVGVHLSVTAIWTTATLSLTVYNVISYLQAEDNLFDVEYRKYTKIISELKIWINITFVGMFFFGLANVFFPNNFVWNL